MRLAPKRNNDNKTYYATAWPIGTLLASTWDTQLINQVGIALGNEVKEYGVDFLLAPGINIQRNPLNGRNFEYYSEDPLLTGKIASAIVSGIESNNVGATIKHFVANQSESNRMFSDSIITPRALREIYLRAFQITVAEAHPWAIMTSYNKVNGTYANHRKDLLINILRDEWGFKGLVMSDWYAGNVISISSDSKVSNKERDKQSAADQIIAGNNLIEPGGIKSNLQASYDSGRLTEDDINKSVSRILTQMQKTPSYKHYVFTNQPDLKAHAKLSIQAATEGMILLKNKQSTLPIAPKSKVASFGVSQINTFKGGSGSTARSL